MSSPALTRCAAGDHCRDGENIEDPDTGERIARLGAIVDDGGPLCDQCLWDAEYAIASLPADMRDLAKLLPPPLKVRYRDPDLPAQPRVKKAPPLPMNEPVWSLMELIVYETTVWAETVADAAGVEWDSELTERSPWQNRVDTSCALLGYRFTQLIGLTGIEHRARSTSVDPTVGHDLDRTIRSRDDVWASRDGWEGALTLEQMHRQALKHAGRHPGDRVPTPCTNSACGKRALVREHRNNVVVCRACKTALTDDDYEDFLTAALKAHGIPVHEPTIVIAPGASA
jgi:hypothetical protein